MKLACITASALIAKTLAYDKDCLRITTPFGDPILEEDVIKSDLTQIQTLDNAETYSVSFIVTCVANGTVSGTRLGISNDQTQTASGIHSFEDTLYLNTMGRSSSRSKCTSVWMPKGVIVSTYKLYRTEGKGIVGTFF